MNARSQGWIKRKAPDSAIVPTMDISPLSQTVERQSQR
ncbi:unnamed protein product [Acidithrix sp. C25]|nr:unnamed protein product [Acidithrix sp. C25]